MRFLVAFLAFAACAPLTATDCRRASAAADLAGLFTSLPLALGVAVVCDQPGQSAGR